MSAGYLFRLKNSYSTLRMVVFGGVLLLVLSSRVNAAPVTPLEIPIFMYHYVEDVRDPHDVLRVKFSVRPYVCEWQIKELCAREYMSYFVREIPLLLDGTLVPASKRIVLTFDDGYEDFYTEVFPLLQKYQVKATLFVINDFLGKPGYLTGEQVKEIAASGLVEIGAHTMHHQNLTYLSLKDAEAEIEQSKEGLEALLATPVQSFAYPYGRYSRRIVPLVRDAGFTAAVGTDFGYWQSPENLFTLKRIHARAFTGRERWFVIGDGA